MIMRWLIRLAFPALGLLLVLIAFGIHDPDTDSITSDADLSTPLEPEKKPAIPAFEGEVPAPISDEGPSIVFKWQDTEGNWHYADKPPAQGPWNALAIEDWAGETPSPRFPGESSDNWQAPYTAPFRLDQNPSHNDS